MEEPRAFRIFISSPSDVGEERAVALSIVRRLAREHESLLRVAPIFWEHEPLTAADGFQPQIGRPSACDVFVCIAWSRLGTPLPPTFAVRADGTPYPSGTAYELEDALAATDARGAPEVLLYLKTAERLVRIDADPEGARREIEQRQALDAYLDAVLRMPDGGVRAHHRFADAARFEELLETHLRRLVERRIAEGVAPGEHPAPAPWLHGSPFRGLEAFEPEHAGIFFGRTRATADVIALLRRQRGRGRGFVLVFGASGAGKSSLARAGVLPRLTAPGMVAGVRAWRRAIARPGSGTTPLAGLAAALLAPGALPELAAGETDADALAQLLAEAPPAAARLAAATLAQSAPPGAEAALILVVDQLEELFTRTDADDGARAAYVRALAALAEARGTWIVATCRSDFYPHCNELEELARLKEGGQYDLLPPRPAEIGEIIRRPTRAARLAYEADPATGARLDDELAEAAARGPLPLLEFALEELYHARTPGGTLTFAAYREMRGLEGALAQRAEAAYARLDPAVRGAMDRVWRGLVQLSGERDEPLRATASLDALARDRAVAAFVEAFVQARLLVTDRAPDGAATVALAHESLLGHWPRLAAWVDENRDALRTARRIREAALDWERQGHDPDALARGTALQRAAEVAKSFAVELGVREHAYIRASVEHEREEEERERRIQQQELENAHRLAAAEHERAETQQHAFAAQTRANIRQQSLIIVLCAVLVMAGIAWGDSRRQAHIARSGELADLAASLLATAPDSAGRVALRAARLHPGPAAVDVLRRALLASPVLHTLPGHLKYYVSSAGWEERRSARFSPDDRWIATSGGGMIRIWNGSSGRLITTLRDTGYLNAGTFSPDGRLVGALARDGPLIWSSRDWSRLPRANVPAFSTMEDLLRFSFLRFSANGGRLLTVSTDNEYARLWILQAGEAPRLQATLSVTSLVDAEFATRGMIVASSAPSAVRASDMGVIQVWDSAGNRVLHARPARVWYHMPAFSLSRDGTLAVSIRPDRFAEVWDVRTGEIRGHSPIPVFSARFHPLDNRIVTSDGSTDVLVWNGTGFDPGQVQILRAEEQVGGAEFTRNGTHVVGYGAKWGRVTWRLADGMRRGAVASDEWYDAYNLSADGSRLVAAYGLSMPRILRLWPSQPEAREVPLRKPVRSITFDKDGRWAAASLDSGLVVVHLASGVVTDSLGWIGAPGAAFNPARPDELLVVSAGDSRVRLLRPGRGIVARGRIHGTGAENVVYSPDGAVAVVYLTDRAYLLDGRSLAVLREWHTSDTIRAVSFSPDGGEVLVATPTRTEIVDWRGNGAPRVLPGSISTSAFTPDGRGIVLRTLKPRSRGIPTLTDTATEYFDRVTGKPAPAPVPLSRLLVVKPYEIAFSPNGQWTAGVFTNNYGTQVSVWEAGKNEQIGLFGYPAIPAASHLAFGPDGGPLLLHSDSTAATTTLWRPEWGNRLPEIPLVENRTYLARISLNGRWLVIAVNDPAGHRLRILPYEMYAPLQEVIRAAEERWGADVA
ncbi:MAG: AAA family ATPase [Longimicrobiaceae bacterium]